MDTEDKSNKHSRSAIRKNELAMAGFSIAFATEKAMNILYASCTENWPDRKAFLVVHELKKRYQQVWILYGWCFKMNNFVMT
jgi:hypothetical protein